MKTSTKKILLATLMAGSLICPNTALAETVVLPNGYTVEVPDSTNPNVRHTGTTVISHAEGTDLAAGTSSSSSAEDTEETSADTAAENTAAENTSAETSAASSEENSSSAENTSSNSSAESLAEDLDVTLSDNTVEIGQDYVEVNGRRGTYGNGRWEIAGRSGTYDWSPGNIIRIKGGNSWSDAQTIGYNFITVNGVPFHLLFEPDNYYGSLIGNRFVFNGVDFSFAAEGNGPSYNGTISGNLFRINGGKFANYYSHQPNLTATNNTVEIAGNADVSNAYLYGGLVGDADNASGNILNVNGVGYTARNIYDFDTVMFNLPASTKNGDVALRLTDGSTNFSNRKINAVIAGGTNLTTGDKITLLANGHGLTTTGTSMGSRFAEGVTLTYDTEMTATGNGVELTLGSARVEEQTRALNQGAIVSTGEITNDTFRIMDALRVEDFDTSDDDSKESLNTMMLTSSLGIFANGTGGKIKTKTGNGSYIKSKSRGFTVGLARFLSDPDSRPFVIAPVFDYGKSTYDSYLADGTHGEGNAKYFLGGLLIRKMYDSGFYWEGSFRGGKSKTDFHSNDLISGVNRVSVGYSDSTPAFAGHIRVGKLQRLGKNNLMHIYGIYSHTHVNGMDTKISTGERYKFDSVDNGTFMLGYRLTTRTSRISQIYTGLAFQYQFNGSSSASYRGYTTPSAKLKGATGILELGWQIT